MSIDTPGPKLKNQFEKAKRLADALRDLKVSATKAEGLSNEQWVLLCKGLKEPEIASDNTRLLTVLIMQDREENG